MIDIHQLAKDIARVLELDGKRTKGEISPEWIASGTDVLAIGDEADWLIAEAYHGENESDVEFIASAPLMADIIKRQRSLLMEAHLQIKSFGCDGSHSAQGCDACLFQNDLLKLIS